MRALQSPRATAHCRAGRIAAAGRSAKTPRRLEFHISYACGNKCVFCSEAGPLAKFRGKDPSPAEIAAVLRDKRAKGFNHVSFTGGEPSLLGCLPQVLGIARACGYTTCLTTNGRAFADRAYAAAALPLLDEMILSVHGADSRTHDELTGNAGSFARTAAALGNIEALAGRRLFLITNTVAVRGNLAQLPRILGWAGKFRAVKQFLVSYPAPEGRAAANYRKLAPGLPAFGRMAPELTAIAARKGKKIRFFGVPACVLGSCAGYSNDFFWSPRLTVERAIRGGAAGFREVLSAAPVRKRFYAGKCLACGYVGVCGGFFYGQARR